MSEAIVPDSEARGLVARLPAVPRALALLARLDRPIGWWLLFWPGAWAVALAGGARERWPLVLWLLLNRSMSAGHILLGTLLALAIPRLTAGLRPLPVHIHSPWAAFKLACTVVVDTTQSNMAVVRLLLRPSTRKHPARFVRIPLEMRDPNALATLAMIVCITPGTVWAELALDRSALLLHVLEVDDPEAVIAHVKQRYERPLMEIFE